MMEKKKKRKKKEKKKRKKKKKKNVNNNTLTDITLYLPCINRRKTHVRTYCLTRIRMIM